MFPRSHISKFWVWPCFHWSFFIFSLFFFLIIAFYPQDSASLCNNRVQRPGSQFWLANTTVTDIISTSYVWRSAFSQMTHSDDYFRSKMLALCWASHLTTGPHWPVKHHVGQINHVHLLSDSLKRGCCSLVVSVGRAGSRCECDVKLISAESFSVGWV